MYLSGHRTFENPNSFLLLQIFLKFNILFCSFLYIWRTKERVIDCLNFSASKCFVMAPFIVVAAYSFLACFRMVSMVYCYDVIIMLVITKNVIRIIIAIKILEH